VGNVQLTNITSCFIEEYRSDQWGTAPQARAIRDERITQIQARRNWLAYPDERTDTRGVGAVVYFVVAVNARFDANALVTLMLPPSEGIMRTIPPDVWALIQARNMVNARPEIAP
jgi:hypothetical protein